MELPPHDPEVMCITQLVILDNNDNCIRNTLHRILITTGNQNHAYEEYPIQFLSLHYAGIILREIGYKFGGIISIYK